MIKNIVHFNVQQIADSGQCFRMNNIGKNTYSVIAYNKYLEIEQLDNNLVDFKCEKEDFESLWADYFDLNYDYGNVVHSIHNSGDDFLKKAVEYGEGIRILKQDLWETIVSFIISQRKSIPAIKSTIEKLCMKFGEKKNFEGKDYYTFPSPEVIAEQSMENLQGLALGYRDKYILSTAKTIVDGTVNLGHIKQMTREDAILELKKLSGVGEKVANCVALYGMHKIDAFPIDVWIQRVVDTYYGGSFDTNTYKGFNGIVQQYMFYYMKNEYKS
jgi:N-glycosylase/DNA lyase